MIIRFLETFPLPDNYKEKENMDKKFFCLTGFTG